MFAKPVCRKSSNAASCPTPPQHWECDSSSVQPMISALHPIENNRKLHQYLLQPSRLKRHTLPLPGMYLTQKVIIYLPLKSSCIKHTHRWRVMVFSSLYRDIICFCTLSFLKVTRALYALIFHKWFYHTFPPNSLLKKWNETTCSLYPDDLIAVLR